MSSASGFSRERRGASRGHLCFGVITLMVLVSFLCVAGIAPASEASGWSYPVKHGPGPISVGPQGQVVLNESLGYGGAPDDDLLETVGSDGARIWRQPFQRAEIPPNPVFDGAGNTYWLQLVSTDDPATGYTDYEIVSRDATGVLRWKETVGGVISGGDSAPLALGANGLLYRATPDLGNGLVLVAASAATGDETMRFNVPGRLSAGTWEGLYPYDNGIVVANMSTLSFDAYDGSAVTNIALPQAPSAYSSFVVSPKGDVFALRGACNLDSSDSCGPGVAKVTPSGVSWVRNLRRSAGHQYWGYGLQGAVLPDGSIVVNALDNDGADCQNGISDCEPDYLLSLDGRDGSTRWRWTAPRERWPVVANSSFIPHIVDLKADANGNIVVLRIAGQDCDPTWTCLSWGVNEISGSNGAELFGFRASQNAGGWEQPFYLGISNGAAFALTGSNSSGTDEFTLHQISVPGLASEYPGPFAEETPSASPSATVSPTEAYVALGDSYSSGEGVPPFDNTDSGTFAESDGPSAGDTFCHRSRDAYSRLAAGELGIDDVHLFACSGAEIKHFYSEQQSGLFHLWRGPSVPPQIERVAGRDDVNLVSLTVGGNDVGFIKVLVGCSDTNDCNTKMPNLDDKIDALKAPLINLYLTILDDKHASNATLAVLGYPALFPGRDQRRCSTFSVNERLWLNNESAHLDKVIERAVAAVRRRLVDPTRILYVNDLNLFSGHELCTQHSWVNGWMPSHKEFSFHPNGGGQVALASHFAAVIKGALTH